MNHKEFKRLSILFIDDELSDVMRLAATDHLSKCESCSIYLQKINSVYSIAQNPLPDIKADTYFYTRLNAKMIAKTISNKDRKQLASYIQPAFYTLTAFTILLFVLIITGIAKNTQQSNSASDTSQINRSDDQNYLKTIAMNDQTFEEEYLKIIDK